MIEELIKQGMLDEAVAEAKSRVRNSPADSSVRIMYFQLCCIQGLWNEALKQLDILSQIDSSSLLFVQIFRDVINAEKQRELVFSANSKPLLPNNTQLWLQELIESLHIGIKGDAKKAEEIRARAFDAAETCPGTLNGQSFQWLADSDTRFGPVIEYIVRSEYRWAPWSAFLKIKCEAPHDLRDFVWLAAQFLLPNGEMFSGFIPARYPIVKKETTNHKILLGKITEWECGYGNTAHGHGRRMLVTDQTELSLLEVREIQFQCAT